MHHPQHTRGRDGGHWLGLVGAGTGGGGGGRGVVGKITPGYDSVTRGGLQRAVPHRRQTPLLGRVGPGPGPLPHISLSYIIIIFTIIDIIYIYMCVCVCVCVLTE